jgi:hypothetical protein
VEAEAEEEAEEEEEVDLGRLLLRANEPGLASPEADCQRTKAVIATDHRA